MRSCVFGVPGVRRGCRRCSSEVLPLDQAYGVDGMKEPKVSVAWECIHCGHRHLWKWAREDAEIEGPLYMGCGRCLDTKGDLVRIGKDAYALRWAIDTHAR